MVPTLIKLGAALGVAWAAELVWLAAAFWWECCQSHPDVEDPATDEIDWDAALVELLLDDH